MDEIFSRTKFACILFLSYVIIVIVCSTYFVYDAQSNMDKTDENMQQTATTEEQILDETNNLTLRKEVIQDWLILIVISVSMCGILYMIHKIAQKYTSY